MLEESPPDVGICYGPVRIFDDSTGLTTSVDRRQWFLPEADMTTRCLALESPTSTQTIVIRANVAREIGGFDTRYTELDDMNFSCRVALRYGIVEFPEAVAIQHISHGHSRMTEEHTTWLARFTGISPTSRMNCLNVQSIRRGPDTSGGQTGDGATARERSQDILESDYGKRIGHQACDPARSILCQGVLLVRYSPSWVSRRGQKTAESPKGHAQIAAYCENRLLTSIAA